MEIFLAVLVGLLLAGTVLLVGRVLRSSMRAAVRPAARAPREGRVIVTLEVSDADPDSAPARRLVREAASRMFAMMPTAEEVEVRTLTGAVLGRSARTLHVRPSAALSPALFEPHGRRAHGPDLIPHLSEDQVLPSPPGLRRAPEPALEGPRWPLTERIDLPERVREHLRDPEDATDLVRAILEAAGKSVERDGNLILTDGQAVLIVRPPGGAGVTPEILNRAYLRIRSTGAGRGLIIAVAPLDHGDVRRREILDPQVLHVGLDGIQRMADAAALGADPMKFAAAPALKA